MDPCCSQKDIFKQTLITPRRASICSRQPHPGNHIMQFSLIQALVINYLIQYPLGCRGIVWVELRVKERNFLSGVIFHCSNSANLFLSWSIVFQPMTIWRDMSRWGRMSHGRGGSHPPLLSRGRCGSHPPLLCALYMLQANWSTVVIFMVFVTRVPIISDSAASSLCDVPPLGSELCKFLTNKR